MKTRDMVTIALYVIIGIAGIVAVGAVLAAALSEEEVKPPLPPEERLLGCWDWEITSGIKEGEDNSATFCFDMGGVYFVEDGEIQRDKKPYEYVPSEKDVGSKHHVVIDISPEEGKFLLSFDFEADVAAFSGIIGQINPKGKATSGFPFKAKYVGTSDEIIKKEKR